MIGSAFLLLIGMAGDQLVEPPAVRRVSVLFEMNDGKYEMPIPEGFCVPNSVPPNASGTETNADGYTMAKPAYLELCDAKNAEDRQSNFVYLQYFTNWGVRDQSKADFIKQAAPNIDNDRFRRWMASDALEQRVEKKTEDQTGVKVDVDIKPEVVGFDDSCVYHARAVLLDMKGQGSQRKVRTISCVTRIGRNVVVVNLTSNRDANFAPADQIKRVRSMADSIVRR